MTSPSTIVGSLSSSLRNELDFWTSTGTNSVMSWLFQSKISLDQQLPNNNRREYVKINSIGMICEVLNYEEAWLLGRNFRISRQADLCRIKIWPRWQIVPWPSTQCHKSCLSILAKYVKGTTISNTPSPWPHQWDVLQNPAIYYVRGWVFVVT